MAEQTHVSDAEGFRKLAHINEVEPGELLQVVLDEEEWEVCLANVDGQIYAFRDVCPHQAFPLSVGRLNGSKLLCAGHAWSFDVKSGKAIAPPIRKTLELYPVRQEANGEIWVKVTTW